MDLHPSRENFLDDSIIEVNPMAYDNNDRHGYLESIQTELPIEAIYEVLQYPERETQDVNRHPRKNHE